MKWPTFNMFPKLFVSEFCPTTHCINADKRLKVSRLSDFLVGKTGFEPATTWSQTRSATGLRYFPLCLFLFCECKGTTIILFHKTFRKLFSSYIEKCHLRLKYSAFGIEVTEFICSFEGETSK